MTERYVYATSSLFAASSRLFSWSTRMSFARSFIASALRLFSACCCAERALARPCETLRLNSAARERWTF